MPGRKSTRKRTAAKRFSPMAWQTGQFGTDVPSVNNPTHDNGSERALSPPPPSDFSPRALSPPPPRDITPTSNPREVGPPIGSLEYLDAITPRDLATEPPQQACRYDTEAIPVGAFLSAEEREAIIANKYIDFKKLVNNQRDSDSESESTEFLLDAAGRLRQKKKQGETLYPFWNGAWLLIRTSQFRMNMTHPWHLACSSINKWCKN